MPYVSYIPKTVRPEAAERLLDMSEWLVSKPLIKLDANCAEGEYHWVETEFENATIPYAEFGETVHWVKQRKPEGGSEPVFKFPLPLSQAFAIALEHNNIVTKLIDNKL